jgi:hypothetical protein
MCLRPSQKSETKTTKIEEEGSIAEHPSHICPKSGSDLLLDHAFRQQCYRLGAQVVHSHEDYGEDVGTVLHEPVKLAGTNWCS